MRYQLRCAWVTGLATFLSLAAYADEPHTDDRGGVPSRDVTVKIIGLNDYHGNLQSPGTFGLNTTIPAAQRPPVGGAEYVAAFVAKLRAENPNNVVVGAGDFILGPMPLISALFFDEPSVEKRSTASVSSSTPSETTSSTKASPNCSRSQQRGGCKITNGTVDPNSCRGAEVGTPVPFEGAKFQWLSANVILGRRRARHYCRRTASRRFELAITRKTKVKKETTANLP